MRKILLAMLFACSLSGCFIGAVAAGGAAAGGFASDPRTMDVINQDEEITFQVTRAIAADKELYEKAHITAVSYNRVVLMVGQAPTAEMRERAAQLAQKVKGIKRIFNQITVAEPTSATRRGKDVAITTAIKARLFGTSDVKSNNYKVVTEDGVVYLVGLTTREQANRTVRIISATDGVQKVVKLLEYID